MAIQFKRTMVYVHLPLHLTSLQGSWSLGRALPFRPTFASQSARQTPLARRCGDAVVPLLLLIHPFTSRPGDLARRVGQKVGISVLWIDARLRHPDDSRRMVFDRTALPSAARQTPEQGLSRRQFKRLRQPGFGLFERAIQSHPKGL